MKWECDDCKNQDGKSITYMQSMNPILFECNKCKMIYIIKKHLILGSFDTRKVIEPFLFLLRNEIL